ncbi:hypothetical protein RPIT_12085 [Tessaracoccus flavus]|uniref:VWFA domain-containing protein n=1 Tax=Tessaracoccus flavus TaxID=1610493 RepID=A0A1Q2CHA9_9ACTN|nr:hypothetical protein RPIT_12085 [Tessaracoccus flavus]
MAGTGQGQLVLLFDESLSLKESDPDAGRVLAGRYLVQRLANLADRSELDLQVMLAGFGTSYRDYQSQWRTLAGADLNGLLTDLESFADRNTDSGTDYWLGLDGARKSLADVRLTDGAGCQAIFFFSDGELDVSLSADERAEGEANPRRPFAPDNDMSTRERELAATAAAAESLCRAGGLADQIRLQDIVMFGVGLHGDDQSADAFDLMRRVVTGGRGQGTCGAQTQPVPGDFVTAADIDSLIFAFDSVTRQRPVNETEICQGDVCLAGTHNFVLDASVERVELLGSADADGIEVQLTAPGGAQGDSSGETSRNHRRSIFQGREANTPGSVIAPSWSRSKQRTPSNGLDSGRLLSSTQTLPLRERRLAPASTLQATLLRDSWSKTSLFAQGTPTHFGSR